MKKLILLIVFTLLLSYTGYSVDVSLLPEPPPIGGIPDAPGSGGSAQAAADDVSQAPQPQELPSPSQLNCPTPVCECRFEQLSPKSSSSLLVYILLALNVFIIVVLAIFYTKRNKLFTKETTKEEKYDPSIAFLKNYMQYYIRLGVSFSIIRQELLKRGYRDDQITTAYRGLFGK